MIIALSYHKLPLQLAHKGISDLKDEMHGQHEEYEGMAGRLVDLEVQLQLLTSGQTLQDDGRRSEVFKDFTGMTSRFLGKCFVFLFLKYFIKKKNIYIYFF